MTHSHSTPTLSLHNITVSFQDGLSRTTVLSDASLVAHAGQVTALVGESGSGKSTLLSVAAGLVVPDSGTMSVGERTMTESEAVRSQIRREDIGMVFQQPNLLPALTAREQLLITDHIRGTKPRTERADALLAQVGLEGLGDRRVTQLSGGQRQRVGIARALMGAPKVLLADEPTSALDSRLSREVMELLVRLSRDNELATVIVTHDRSQLAMMDAAVDITDGHTRVLARSAA